MPLKVLFLVSGGITHPSARFRVYQLLPYFEQVARIEIVDVIVIHGKLSLFKLVSTFLKLVKQAQSSDVIFIQRVPLPILLLCGLVAWRRIVFDFDDAIFVPSVSWPAGKDFGQRQRVVNYILSRAHVVIAGNDYLKNYACRYSGNVVVVPTVVDTGLEELDAGYIERWKFSRQVFRPVAKGERSTTSQNSIVIGWIGTSSHIQWLNPVGPTLRALQEKYGVQVKVVSNCEWHFPGLQILNKNWRLEDEVADVQSFDVGLMPLDANVPYLEGKCGFKLIEYMATGSPGVASAIGVNSKIVHHGSTGFLVTDPSEWTDHLEKLVQDPSLRDRMGEEARRYIVENYSITSVLPKYLSIFGSLAD